MQFILIFLLVTFLDIIWVFYIRWVNKGNKFIASITAGVMYFFSAVIVISYIDNNYNLIPAICGAFTGTYLGIIIENKITKK